MPLSFPKNFIFGVADADLQVMGEDALLKEERAEKTLWYEFAKTSGKCVNNDSPAEGIDRYHRWREDVELLKRYGIKHFRTSVSMARLLKRDGTVNKKAVQWYQQYFQTLRNNGVHLYITLYHWDLPLFLYEQGGWKNLRVAEWISKHAVTVYEYLGEYIDEYFILNEPWVIALRGYYYGAQAPGEEDLTSALLVGHHVLLTQGMVYDALRRKDADIKISTVYNVAASYANTTDEEDIMAALYADGSLNTWFLDPLYLGKYPESMVERYGKKVPKINQADMKGIKIGDKLHSLGLNYYFSNIVQYTSTNELHGQEVLREGGKTTGLGWPITTPPVYPEGFYDILTQLYFAYRSHGLKRIYIAENGIALDTPWDSKTEVIKDPLRIWYLSEHLKQLEKAMRRGVPVEAFFYWTFMDNYEWQRGYGPETAFGLIHIDRPSMKRVPKESMEWFAKIAKTKTLIE